MNKKQLYIIVVLTIVSCKNSNQSSYDKPSLNEPVIQNIQLNLAGGYVTNQYSGDTIYPLINSLGETIKTGIPIPAEGKIFIPHQKAKPKIIQAGKPKIVTSHLNIHKIPPHLTTIAVNKNKLSTFTPGTDTSSFILINSTGQIVQTGVAIPVSGKVQKCVQPVPVPALPPRMKDNASKNIKYMDIGQGMNSSCILSLLEDKRGNIWMGTNGGGVSMYNGQTFTHYTEKEGVSSNIVWSMLEDTSGNIWFGTNGGGVIKYDGKTFTHITEKEGLGNNRILAIGEDHNGNLWFGTNGGGVSRYDGLTLTNFSKKEGLSDNIIRSVVEDRYGNLWFGTYSSGVCKYDGKTFTHYSTKDGLSNNSVLPILEDKKGNLWFGTWNGGVTKFDGQIMTHYTTKEGLIHNNINYIIEDKLGNIWFGTWEGVSMFDGKTFTNYTEKEGLSYNDVICVLEDSHENIWFGSWTGGVSVYNRQSFTNYTENEGLSNNHVFALNNDHLGNIWIGSWGGVSKYDGNSFTHYTQNEGLSYNYVYSIMEDSKYNLWFGTDIGVSKFDGKTFTNFTKKEGLINNSVKAIIEDRNGDIWFGIQDGGLCKYDGTTFTHFTEKEGLSHNNVKSIIIDSQNNLWIATLGGGVTKYDGTTFTHFTEKEGLSSNYVNSVVEDSEGNIWFGTIGGGANLFNGTSFTYFDSNIGLNNNTINSILEYDNSIWISTDKGLNRLLFLNAKSGKILPADSKTDIKPRSDNIPIIYTFGEQDGVKGINFNPNAVLLDNKNRIWLGSGQGVNVLEMKSFKTEDATPLVQLNYLTINEQYIDFRNVLAKPPHNIKYDDVAPFYNYPLHLQLPHKRNHLTFHFSAKDWSSPHKIKFRHKMEGINEAWSLPTTEAKADYRNLPYGSYTFNVQASEDLQTWSLPFNYSFSVLPPWWQTLYAKGVYALLAWVLIFSFIQWRTYKLNQRKKELEQIVKERTSELKLANSKLIETNKFKSIFLANMSHELRTPLNSVITLSGILYRRLLNKIPDDEYSYLEVIERNGKHLLKLINDILDISRIEAGREEIRVTLFNSDNLITDIINLIKPQAEQKNIQLNYVAVDGSMAINNDFDKCYHILQNLIANAIKFTESGEIKITSFKSGNKISFSVSDTGIGIAKNQQLHIFDEFKQADSRTSRKYGGTGLGLSIAKKYATLLGGTISVNSTLGKGSEFIFEVPLQYKRNN